MARSSGGSERSAVLVIGPEPNRAESLRRIIGELRHPVLIARSPGEGEQLLEIEDIGTVLIDLDRLGDKALELLRKIRLRRPGLHVAALSGRGDPLLPAKAQEIYPLTLFGSDAHDSDLRDWLSVGVNKKS